MIKQTHKLTLKTILTSIIAIAGLVTPAIAQGEHSIKDNQTTVNSSTLLANNALAKDEFRCELGDNNFYRTIAYTKQGRTIGLITWKGITNQGSGYSPEQRCRILAYRFQRFSDAGQLRYVSTGIMNRQAVICISSSGGVCQRNGLLLTLDPKDDPEQALKELFDVGSRVDGEDFVRGANTIDITKLLYGTP